MRRKQAIGAPALALARVRETTWVGNDRPSSVGAGWYVHGVTRRRSAFSVSIEMGRLRHPQGKLDEDSLA
jgi:hypothetical protein